MARITDFHCYFNGKELLADAFGNNIAFACPKCSHPVLLSTIVRGNFQKNPSVCRNKKCGQKYWQESINDDDEKIIIQSER